jgi:hypothetical protein
LPFPIEIGPLTFIFRNTEECCGTQHPERGVDRCVSGANSGGGAPGARPLKIGKNMFFLA